jgi:hypothetical protein
LPRRSEDARRIEDHALLSDCQTAALNDGTLDWWPGPRFDSPSLFSALLDEAAGHWTIQPAGGFDAERRHLSDTLVLETTMRTDGGALRLRCACVRSGIPRVRHRVGWVLPRMRGALARAPEHARSPSDTRGDGRGMALLGRVAQDVRGRLRRPRAAGCARDAGSHLPAQRRGGRRPCDVPRSSGARRTTTTATGGCATAR